jgi:hypothetical protein
MRSYEYDAEKQSVKFVEVKIALFKEDCHDLLRSINEQFIATILISLLAKVLCHRQTRQKIIINYFIFKIEFMKTKYFVNAAALKQPSYEVTH